MVQVERGNHTKKREKKVVPGRESKKDDTKSYMEPCGQSSKTVIIGGGNSEMPNGEENFEF